MSFRGPLPIALAVVAATGCATTVAVAPGHRAVLTDPAGATALLDEGVATIPGGSTVDDFDLREQQLGGTFRAITADGVALAVINPIVGYRPIAGELAAADRTVGPDPRPLVAAIVQATIARVVAGYTFRQLDTDGVRAAQAKIIALAAPRLRRYHLALSSVELKGLVPRRPDAARAATATSVWEQRSLEAGSRLAIARQQADALRERAAGVAASHREIAPTLSPSVLGAQREKAWEALLASPRVGLVVDEDPSTVEVSP